MKAIAIVPHTRNISLVEIDEPRVIAADEVKIKILQVGICGTDREETRGGRADAPAGKKELIIGHEMLGQVVETGRSVTKIKTGDLAVFTVRRGCEQCAACKNNRSDMCYTGNYTERGIKGADGYQAEYVVDKEQYVVKVPDNIADIGVLTEPMSVAAKAIDEAIMIQEGRLKDFDNPFEWLKGKRALVAGIGPIGLMAAFALRLKGAEVLGLDIVDDLSLRPTLLKAIGGEYINGNAVNITDVDEKFGQIDFAFEATGIANLQFQIIDAVGINGIYVATGIPSGERPLTIHGAKLMDQLVLMNQVVLGSVNASVNHYMQAVEYLAESKKRWPDVIKHVITHRYDVDDFHLAFTGQLPDEIKVVINWS
jgi:threonine dehydrogenase-like Zn-dependent dehydrogenase